MKSVLLDERLGRRTFAAVFDVGDEVAEGLLELARQHRLSGSHFTAIGALRSVVLGYWVPESGEYVRIPIREQVEVVSMLGNVARGEDGSPRVHAHLVVAKRDGSAHGGHLIEAVVEPTLEVVLTEEPEHLRRRHDARTGLPLIDLGSETPRPNRATRSP